MTATLRAVKGEADMEKRIRKVTVDPDVHACYVLLSDNPVDRTFEYSDDILVDLDKFGVAVGIEVLDPRAVFPLDDLVHRLHIHSRDEAFLAQLLPTIEHSLRFSVLSAPDATVVARTSDGAMQLIR